MAKNFKNLNSHEKYQYLFDTYKTCIDCGKMKTYNCFFDREKFKLRKLCTICERKKVKHEQFKMVMSVLNGMDLDGI